jgi:hypothetical protein
VGVSVYVHAEGAGDAVVGGADGGLDVDPEAIARVLGGAGGGVGVPLREQRRLGGGGRRRGGGPGAGGEPLHLGPTTPERTREREGEKKCTGERRCGLQNLVKPASEAAA